MIEKLKTLEMYGDGRYWALLAAKINEIIDHINAVEEDKRSQWTRWTEDGTINFCGFASRIFKGFGTIDLQEKPTAVLKILEYARQDKIRLMRTYGLHDGGLIFYEKITRIGARKTAVIKLPGSGILVGRAVCSPQDQYYPEIGEIIALRRALKLEVPHYYTHMPQKKEEVE